MNADYSSDAGFNSINLRDAERDLKRVLKMQFKEFIHTIEDHELIFGAKGSNRFNQPVTRGCSLYRLHVDHRNVA